MASINMTRLCTTCGQGAMQRCSGCKLPYCTKPCQKNDWYKHRSYCEHVKSDGVYSASFSAHAYYQLVATQDPKVKALAKEIHLTLPDLDDGHFSLYKDTTMALRRLVITGNDTAENITLFFGRRDKDRMKVWHQDARVKVLLRPLDGSAMHLDGAFHLDKDCPAWTPRPATEDEARRVDDIIVMEVALRVHLGLRPVCDFNQQDLDQFVLTPVTPEIAETIQYALNSSSQWGCQRVNEFEVVVRNGITVLFIRRDLLTFLS